MSGPEVRGHSLLNHLMTCDLAPRVEISAQVRGAYSRLFGVLATFSLDSLQGSVLETASVLTTINTQEASNAAG
jgi:hypothetical protein